MGVLNLFVVSGETRMNYLHLNTHRPSLFDVFRCRSAVDEAGLTTFHELIRVR